MTFSVFRAAAPPPGVFGRGPDLVAEPITPNSGPLGLCRRSGSVLTVRVRNQGNEPAVVPTTTRVEFPGGEQTFTTPPLPNGAAADLMVPLPANCFHPDCDFEIQVDADDAVEEPGQDATDILPESNNIAAGRCFG